MIQPLRTIHRRAFVALAFALPAVLIAGLESRHPRSHRNVSPAQLPASVQMLKDSASLWRKHAIRSQFYAAPGHPQEVYVVLEPEQELNEPDLLLYWAAGAPQGTSLPASAQLLGGFVPGKSVLLPGGGQQPGALVLFSLGHQTVVDAATVEKLP